MQIKWGNVRENPWAKTKTYWKKISLTCSDRFPKNGNFDWLLFLILRLQYQKECCKRVSTMRTKVYLSAAVPGLTSQRHSALISSDSEYFHFCFSAVHYLKISEQRWVSAVQHWKPNVSEQRKSALNSADSELFLFETALFSSETALNFSVLNSADSEKIRADQLWNRAD